MNPLLDQMNITIWIIRYDIIEISIVSHLISVVNRHEFNMPIDASPRRSQRQSLGDVLPEVELTGAANSPHTLVSNTKHLESNIDVFRLAVHNLIPIASAVITVRVDRVAIVHVSVHTNSPHFRADADRDPFELLDALYVPPTHLARIRRVDECSYYAAVWIGRPDDYMRVEFEI